MKRKSSAECAATGFRQIRTNVEVVDLGGSADKILSVIVQGQVGDRTVAEQLAQALAVNSLSGAQITDDFKKFIKSTLEGYKKALPLQSYSITFSNESDLLLEISDVTDFCGILLKPDNPSHPTNRYAWCEGSGAVAGPFPVAPLSSFQCAVGREHVTAGTQEGIDINNDGMIDSGERFNYTDCPGTKVCCKERYVFSVFNVTGNGDTTKIRIVMSYSPSPFDYGERPCGPGSDGTSGICESGACEVGRTEITVAVGGLKCSSGQRCCRPQTFKEFFGEAEAGSQAIMPIFWKNRTGNLTLLVKR